LRHKRCKTLIGKSDQLVKLGARIYMVAEVNGRYHVYSSESSDSWPPTEASLVSTHGNIELVTCTYAKVQSRNYPVPIRYSPRDTGSPVCTKRQPIEEKEGEAEVST
jgi:hypothetical protein